MTAAARSSSSLGQRARVDEHAPVGDPGEQRRIAGAQRGGQRLRVGAGGPTATAGPGRSSSGSAPPPTRATASTSSPPVAAREALGAAREDGGLGGEHREHRNLRARAGRVAVQGERRRERGHRQATDAQRAGRAGGAGRPRPPRRGPRAGRPAARRAACRALQHTRAAPAATERRTGGSPASSSGPSARTPEPTSSMTGTPRPHSASIPTSSTKPTVRKFDGCTRSDHRARGVAQRLLVVGQARAVRRADLDEPRARLRDDVGHAEAAADLHELAAGDDDRPARGRRARPRRAAWRRRRC